MNTINTPGKKILVVDDEEHIIELMRMNLRTRGYDGIFALSGEEALDIIRSSAPDLIVLDVMLPGIDGIEVCRLLKNDPPTRSIPVLMLSAKSEGMDKIHGLQGGADDYITKPFSMEELFLRIHAALRQVELLSRQTDHVLKIGSLSLDTGKYQAESGKERIDLTLTEFRILHFLMLNRENAVSRDSIYREIFDKTGADTGRAVDVHIRNIRRKLAAGEVKDCAIETVHGSGYRITETA